MNYSQYQQFQHQVLQAEILSLQTPLGLSLDIDSFLQELNEPLHTLVNSNDVSSSKPLNTQISRSIKPLHTNVSSNAVSSTKPLYFHTKQCLNVKKNKKCFLTTMNKGSGKIYKVYSYY
jgi:hypothetical protein